MFAHTQAEKRVDKEVARRLEVISADETLWPRGAQETVTRQSQKLEAVHKMLAGLQNELDTEQHRLAEEQAAKANLQVGAFFNIAIEVSSLLRSWQFLEFEELAGHERRADRRTAPVFAELAP